METATTSVKIGFSQRIVQILLGVLVFIGITVNVLAPIFALNWAESPFIGTLLYPKLVVSNYYHADWATNPPVVQPYNILQAIDGQPLASGQALTFQLRQKQIGDEVRLTFESSPSQSQTASVQLSHFPIQHLLTFFWLPYTVGLIYLGASYVIYRLRGLDHIGGLCIAFSITASIFLAGLFDYHTYHFLTPIWAFSYPFIGGMLLHFALIFPDKSFVANRYPQLYLLPYALSSLLAGFYLFIIYLSNSPHLIPTSWLSIHLFIGVAFAIFAARVLYVRFTTISSIIRQQTSIILGGSVISLGSVGIWTVLILLGNSIQITQAVLIAIFLPLTIFPLSLAYAMLRYRKIDLDITFSRATVYVILTLLISINYIGIASLLSVMLKDEDIFRDPILLTVFVTTLVIALGPLKERIQTYINERFLQITVDYRQMQQNYGRDLIATPLSVDKILQMLAQQTDEALAADPIAIFLRTPVVDAFTIRHQAGLNTAPVKVRFGLSDDLAQWLSDTNDILQISPSGELLSAGRIHPEEVARLNMLHISLCVPLLGSKRLLGWLAMGLKKSGQPYGSDDLMFLATIASQTTIALENAQLLEEANQRAAELEALQEISVTVQAKAEPDSLLISVVEHATQLLHVQGGLVWLLKPDDNKLEVMVSHNLDQDYTGRTLNKSQDIAGRVLLLGEPVAVDNYQTFSGQSTSFSDSEFGAALGVPLRWSGRVQGVLQLIHRPGGLRFTESDIWLMKLFATQSSLALEKSRLLQEAQRRANQLAMLSEVSKTISSTLNLKTVLSQVMDSAVEILNVEAGSLFLMDSTGQELTFEVVLGPSGSELIGAKISTGVGIVGTVAQTSDPLIINDVSNDPRWHTSFDEETKFRTRDILCVPMIASDRVVGVIEVINKQDRQIFTTEDASLLLSFAVQAAIVIENAQIFTRTDQALAERVQELQSLQIFDQQLQKSLDLDKVMDISLTQAMDVLGVPIGALGIFKGKQEDGLYLSAQYGTSSEMHRYKTEPWPVSKGLIGQVARTGQPVMVNDLSQNEQYARKSRISQSMLVVPILRDEAVIGVIDLESITPDYFSEGDISFVQLLASHAAFAIQNAQLFEQAQAANEAKSEFMNTASHDLKVPMTSIKGYAKMLRIGAGGPLSDTQQEFVDVIYNNIERMSRLVSDLLDVSRIEAGRIRLEIEDVQIAAVIDDVISSVGAQIEERQLKLNLDVQPTLPTLRADYHRLVQIMTNFVSNAYKYTPDGGDVTISAKVVSQKGQDDQVAISIKDSGYGISKEDQAKLFTTFFRATDPNIRAQPGTGLGLSITKKMIESHGGTLTLESELGQGSTFTFTLPLISKIPPGVEVSEK